MHTTKVPKIMMEVYPYFDHILLIPRGNTIEELARVGSAEGLHGAIPNEGEMFHTYWTMTDEEFEHFKNTRVLQLTVMGSGFPPVAMKVVERLD